MWLAAKLQQELEAAPRALPSLQAPVIPNQGTKEGLQSPKVATKHPPRQSAHGCTGAGWCSGDVCPSLGCSSTGSLWVVGWALQQGGSHL